jgi:hypothetical protein
MSAWLGVPILDGIVALSFSQVLLGRSVLLSTFGAANSRSNYAHACAMTAMHAVFAQAHARRTSLDALTERTRIRISH